MVKDRLTALGLFGVSVLYLLGCFQLQWGTMRKPGAGFLPTLVGVALFFCTGIYLVLTVRRGPESRPESAENAPASDPRVVWRLLVCTLVYPFVLSRLDFVMATFLVVWGMLLSTRYRTPVVSLLLALFLSLFFFGVFAMLLGVAFPNGPVEQFLYGLRG